MRFKKYVKKKKIIPKKYSKVKKYRKYSKIVPRGPSSPFPLVMYKKLTFSTQISLTQSTGTVPIYHLFRANSIYDPDQTSTGIRPRFAQILTGANGGTGIYHQYRVLGSKISCKIFPTTSTAVDMNACFAITPLNASSGVPATLNEMKERPYSRYTYTTTLGSAKPYSCSNAIGLAKFLGNKDIMDNPDSAAVYNANPVDSVSWALTACAVSDAGLTSLNVIVTITYACQFFNQNDVANAT